MATPSGQSSGRRRPRPSNLNPPEMQQRRPTRSTATCPSMPPGAGPSMPPGAFLENFYWEDRFHS